jgi:DNA repair exonuclease SbcCD ATPase subunit
VRIRRIEISAFRCFRDTVVIDGIDDGITLLVGDNEEGKSTVLTAVQTVLFEKHSVGGTAAAAMLPYASKVRPEIVLYFEHDGTEYRLSKAFCQRPAAELEANTGARWSGDAAEDALRAMLEFTPPGRGGAKLEHRGLQALFWVEQGEAFRKLHINESAQTSLAGALEAEIGTVTGGERGRTLIKRVESRVNEIFTPRSRNPRGAYKAAIDGADEARERRDDLAARLEDFEGKVDDLTRRREDLTKLEADDPIGVADRRLEKARDGVRHVEGQENNLRAAVADRGSARSRHQLTKARFDQRRKDRGEADRADGDVRGLKEKESTADAAADDARKAFEHAGTTHAKAKRALDATRKAATHARQLADLLGKQEELGAAKKRLAKAEAAEEGAVALLAKANANTLTPDAIESLRHLEGTTREEAARLKAVATLIELAPDAGRQATMKGEAIPAPSLTLTEPTRIELEGYGAILVTPGGEDLSTRRETAEAAAALFQSALEKHGADDLHHAERQGRDRQDWLREAGVQRVTVEAQAPGGLDTLREAVADLGAAVARIAARLGDIDRPETFAQEEADRADGLARKLVEAEAVERGASDELGTADARLQSTKSGLQAAVDRRGEVEKSARDLRGDLDKSAIADSDEALEKVLADATKAVTDTSAAVEGIENALAVSDPDGARREIGAATEARAKVERNLQELGQKTRDLEIELRTLGQGDIAAELEVSVGELDRIEARSERLRHEAEALTLLHTILAEKEQTAREVFLKPVGDRIEPYLKHLFPGSEVVLDDQTLNITHLRRENQDEPYEGLSIGTREQLAVLARLAFADLLDEHGKQSPIILDDALVFSDDRRFEEMQRILDRAAERLQIIVLTCHERAYFDRGWTTKILRESKRSV